MVYSVPCTSKVSWSPKVLSSDKGQCNSRTGLELLVTFAEKPRHMRRFHSGSVPMILFDAWRHMRGEPGIDGRKLRSIAKDMRPESSNPLGQ